MARLLLVHPLFLAKSEIEQAAASPYFPLGLLYLAGYVREAGHEVSVFDATFCADESAFAATLAAQNPDLVGISALLPSRSVALELAAMAAAGNGPTTADAQRRPLIVMGGPDPTATPQAYLANDAVDLVVHHEGEQTIVRLLDLINAGALPRPSPGLLAKDLPTVLATEPGVAYRSGDHVTINAPRPPIENLDELPLPARDLIDMERYLAAWEQDAGYRSITIATSRGCPYGCAWCVDAVHGDRFRQRSPESVAAEVAALDTAYKVDRLRMVDDVDGIERSWFDQWAAASATTGTTITFEPLNDIASTDLPLLDVQDTL